MGPVIRVVEVELLRRGPRHNQLLSPLTDYLAVCADFPGGVVNVPYEQSEAENLLDELRYTVASTETSGRLGSVRERAGAQLAAMLESIPGLGGLLATDHDDAVSLTHLRMVTSAGELALLPFELSKGPVGSGGIGDDWLQLQPDRPVCLTRHVARRHARHLVAARAADPVHQRPRRPARCPPRRVRTCARPVPVRSSAAHGRPAAPLDEQTSHRDRGSDPRRGSHRGVSGVHPRARPRPRRRDREPAIAPPRPRTR